MNPDWNESKALMHALADGELSPAEREQAERLMREHPALRAEYETAQVVRGVLARGCAPIVDDAAWEDCRRRIADLDRVRRTESFVGRYAWGIAGAFLVLIAGAATMNRISPNGTLYTGDVARITSSMATSPFERVASSAPRAEQWLHKACGKSLVALDGRDLIPVAAASGTVEGRPVARVDLEDARGELVLIAVGRVRSVDGTGTPGDEGLCRHRVGEMNCVSWQDGDYAVLLMGDRPHDDLAQIAASIRVER